MSTATAAHHSLHIVFGVNETIYLGEGWYGRERFHAGITGRQIGKRGEFNIDMTGASEVAVTYVAHSETVGHPIHGALFLGDFLLGRLNVENNLWKTSVFHVPEGLPKGILAVETHNPWCPEDFFHNGDGRVVGLAFSAIRIGYRSVPDST